MTHQHLTMLTIAQRRDHFNIRFNKLDLLCYRKRSILILETIRINSRDSQNRCHHRFPSEEISARRFFQASELRITPDDHPADRIKISGGAIPPTEHLPRRFPYYRGEVLISGCSEGCYATRCEWESSKCRKKFFQTLKNTVGSIRLFGHLLPEFQK